MFFVWVELVSLAVNWKSSIQGSCDKWMRCKIACAWPRCWECFKHSHLCTNPKHVLSIMTPKKMIHRICIQNRSKTKCSVFGRNPQAPQPLVLPCFAQSKTGSLCYWEVQVLYQRGGRVPEALPGWGRTKGGVKWCTCVWKKCINLYNLSKLGI